MRVRRTILSMRLLSAACGARRLAARSTARWFSTQPAAAFETAAVPVIDLSSLHSTPPGQAPPAELVAEVAAACEQWGFFQVSTTRREPCE